ncbi:MAG: hypothetical protein ABH872_03140 [Candidatus Omnitrophota bacterium]
MKNKKSVLLFEVAIVVLLVSLASLFLFRGYGVFIKTGRKSLVYLKLISLAEEKIWDLKLKNCSGVKLSEIAASGEFDGGFSWRIDFTDTDFENIKETRVTVRNIKNNISFDSVLFLEDKP